MTTKIKLLDEDIQKIVDKSSSEDTYIEIVLRIKKTILENYKNYTHDELKSHLDVMARASYRVAVEKIINSHSNFIENLAELNTEKDDFTFFDDEGGTTKEMEG